MSTVVIVGAQWGDEGKGKIVDFCTESADLVVRYAGGPNAGHTLVVGSDKLIVRLIPSGILRREARCVLGQGMVIDPAVLVGEMDELARRGLDPASRLFISDRAHLILPYHIQVDTLRETASGRGPRLGTTRRGNGPAYEDKAARRGVLTGHLRDLAACRDRIAESLRAWAPVIRDLGGEVPSLDAATADLPRLAERIVPRLTNTSRLIDEAIRERRGVLLEGAQGTLLDIDHGTYPFVTSSSAVAGGAAAGAGIGPTRIDRVIGIAKAYSTRVGGGPFPTELLDELGAKVREDGAEFGSVTGRPRRIGWIDLPALRHAARVNGLDGLAVTKLDVLTGHRKLEVCVAYDTPNGRTTELPLEELLEHADRIRPVYETLDGWTEPLHQARTLDDLPSAARAYLRFLEERVEVPLCLVSVGARRDETIVLDDPFAGGRRAPTRS